MRNLAINPERLWNELMETAAIRAARVLVALVPSRLRAKAGTGQYRFWPAHNATFDFFTRNG